MLEQDFTIHLQFGLHARPASLIVSKLGPLKLDKALMTCKGVTADMKSIMGMLTLAAEFGTPAKVKISGPDAETAMKLVEKILTAENFEAVFDDLKGR